MARTRENVRRYRCAAIAQGISSGDIDGLVLSAPMQQNGDLNIFNGCLKMWPLTARLAENGARSGISLLGTTPVVHAQGAW